MAETPQSAWMWTLDDELRALTLDLERGRLAWFDQIGCHCGDSTTTQSIAAFRQEGPPPFIGPLPADVATALEAALATANPTV